MNPRPQPADETRQGVAVIVAPFDNFSFAWGIRADQLQEAGRAGAIRAGWHLNNSSPFLITIVVSSLAQTDEDLYAFRIEVHGGESELARAAEDSTRWIPDVSARRTVKVPKDGTDRVAANVTDMAEGVAAQLRTDILYRDGLLFREEARP